MEILISIHAPARGATIWIHSGLVIIHISIHAPARGATETWQHSACSTGFQSTLPRGERLLALAKQVTNIQFQSTLPRGERRKSDYKSVSGKDFNPRSREGSDMIDSSSRREISIFQSTLPRGERRVTLVLKPSFIWISIHAPARGATFSILSGLCLFGISIHAPARGATEPGYTQPIGE